MFASLNVLTSCILGWLILGTYCCRWFEQELSALHVVPSSTAAPRLANTRHTFNCAPLGKRDFQHPLSHARTPRSHIPSRPSANLATSNYCPTVQQHWRLCMFSVSGWFCRLVWQQ